MEASDATACHGHSTNAANDVHPSDRSPTTSAATANQPDSDSLQEEEEKIRKT